MAVLSGITIFCVGNATDFSVAPGNLGKVFESHKVIEDGILNLKGRIDVRDIYSMRNLPEGVSELNLSGLTLVSYTSPDSPYEGRLYYPEGEIPEYSMFGLKVKKLSLPGNVVVIEQGALAGGTMESITLPSNLETIGDYAFYDCNSLKNIALPAKVSSIGESAFGNCGSLKTISLESTGVRSIPPRLFAGCTSLESVVFPSKLEEIGREAFAGTAISSITLDDAGIAAPYALAGMTNLKDITIKGTGGASEGLLFGNSSLETISGTPGDVPSLFVAGCSNLDLTELVRNALSLGSFSLAGNKGKKLVLGSDLQKVDLDCFTGISGLSTIDATNLTKNVPEVVPGAFDAINPEDIILYVGSGNYEQWTQHPDWSKFKVIKTGNSTGMLFAEHDSVAISCNQLGNSLEVRSNVLIDRVEVYSVRGSLLAYCAPDSDSVIVNVDIEGEQVVVVRVDAGSVVKIFKLAVK